MQAAGDQLLALLRKSLRAVLQETGIPYSLCQRAAKTVPISCDHTPKVASTVFRERVQYGLWFQHLAGEYPWILYITWFIDEALFYLSSYINSQSKCVWALQNSHELHMELLHSEEIGVSVV